METIEYTTVDKSGWGDGPWLGEPDKRQWTDATTGLPCLSVRNHGGAWCGYAGVTEQHPLFGAAANDVDGLLHCHGGLNFASLCRPAATEADGVCHRPAPGEAEHVWWFGFDASHGFDVSPAIDATLRAIGHTMASFPGFEQTYRDLPYITAQVAGLARQLKALEAV